jgi:hypothetical protein
MTAETCESSNGASGDTRPLVAIESVTVAPDGVSEQILSIETVCETCARALLRSQPANLIRRRI